MVFSFRNGEQLGNIVITEPLAQAERTRLGAVRPGGWRRKDLIQPHTQRCIDHLFERLAQLGRTFSCLVSDIGIERQCGSHVGIMMP